MPKKSGVILISLGAVLILAALLLFLYNRGDDFLGEEVAQRVNKIPVGIFGKVRQFLFVQPQNMVLLLSNILSNF